MAGGVKIVLRLLELDYLNLPEENYFDQWGRVAMLAARMLQWQALGAKRALFGRPRGRGDLQQTVQWMRESSFAAATIHEHEDGFNLAAAFRDDIDDFLNPASPCHHVFGNDDAFAWLNDESASENQFPFLFFRKNGAGIVLPGNLIADRDAAQRWRNYQVGRFFNRSPSDQCGAQILSGLGVLQHPGALEELVAVQPRTQLKVPLAQGPCFFENGQNILWFQNRRVLFADEIAIGKVIPV